MVIIYHRIWSLVFVFKYPVSIIVDKKSCPGCCTYCIVQQRYFVQQSTIVTKNILSRVPNHTVGSLCILYLFQLSFLPPIDLSFIIMETACLLDSLLTCIYFTSIASIGFFCTYNYTKSVGIIATALKVLIFIGRPRPIDHFFLSFFPRGG